MPATLEPPTKREKPGPKPRVVEEYSRVAPTTAEVAAHDNFVSMQFAKPPKTMFRSVTDFPEENALGWKRFTCRGIDNVMFGPLRIREHAWPMFFILAPDRETAENVYRDAVLGESQMAGRKREQIEVIVNELPD